MKFKISISILSLFLFFKTPAWCQCTWHTVISDGFEYSTVCPDAIPDIAYTLVPQSYAAHSGQKSLYLNFKDYNGTTNTGVNAGDTVYARTIDVCPNVPIQVSAWLRTTFSGGNACNMHLIITDANNNLLNEVNSLALPFPTWQQYTSGSITPTTTSIKFIMITNIAGGNGNDLSFDDFLVEQCTDMVSGGTYTDTLVCENQTITLIAQSGFDTYLWNNNTETQQITVSNTNSQTDTLTFTVILKDTILGCKYIDTIAVINNDCTGFKEQNILDKVEIYPNPNNAQFYISSSGSPIVSTSIFNTAGSIQNYDCTRINFSKQICITPNLPNGYYNCRVLLENGTTKTLRFILNKN